MGEYSFADFESHERLFRVTSAVIEEAPGKPCEFDDYNPSAELSDGSFLVRREESCGTFTAYSVSVGAARAGLSDAAHGKFEFESVLPYDQMVNRVYGRRAGK